MDRFKIEVNKKGHPVRRESFDLVFRQSFHYGDSVHFYVRSLVGMANNCSGQVKLATALEAFWKKDELGFMCLSLLFLASKTKFYV